MRKRGRGEGDSDRQQGRLLLAVVIAMHWQEALAIYPPTVGLLHRRVISSSCKNRQDATRERIESLVLLQSRGGAASAGVNWDEPYYSDSSDGEEQQGSNFLPNREEPIKQDVVETESPPEPVEFEGDDTEDEDDESLLDSPFLHSFQREIHSIVRDYRQEVSETFQHLKEDIIYSRDRIDSETPKRRTSRRRSPSSRGNAPREAERTTKKSKPRNRVVPKPVDLEEDSNDSDDFVVGNSDEDNDDVLMKLNPAPRRRFAMGEDSGDNEEAIAIQRKQLRKKHDTEMDGGDDVDTAAADLDSEDEEGDELAFQLMDDWASTKNNAWDNNARVNNTWDNIPRQENDSVFGDGAMVRGVQEKQVDDEIQSSSNSDPKKAAKKRRKRRKKSPNFPPSGGEQSAEDTRVQDFDAPKEADFVEENDTMDPSSGDEPWTPDSRAPIESNTFEPSDTSNAMASSTADNDLAVPQMWKAATVVVSFLAIAILINVAMQILSRLLWKKPE